MKKSMKINILVKTFFLVYMSVQSATYYTISNTVLGSLSQCIRQRSSHCRRPWDGCSGKLNLRDKCHQGYSRIVLQMCWDRKLGGPQ